MGEGSACGLYLPSPLDIVPKKRLEKWILGVDFWIAWPYTIRTIREEGRT
jgi:hypothetical protein